MIVYVRKKELTHTISVNFAMFIQLAHIQTAVEVAIPPDLNNLASFTFISCFGVRYFSQKHSQVGKSSKSFKFPDGKKVIEN